MQHWDDYKDEVSLWSKLSTCQKRMGKTKSCFMLRLLYAKQ